MKIGMKEVMDVVNKMTSLVLGSRAHINRLFMCQDEDENEPEDESFCSFWIKPVTNEPGPQYYDTLKVRFVRHALAPEQTKALVFVFVFVFVLAHEQAISNKINLSSFL